MVSEESHPDDGIATANPGVLLLRFTSLVRPGSIGCTSEIPVTGGLSLLSRLTAVAGAGESCRSSTGPASGSWQPKLTVVPYFGDVCVSNASESGRGLEDHVSDPNEPSSPVPIAAASAETES